MTKLSVIMPVYNKAKYLAHGLQSVLDQSFRDFEFLIINDGSTDNSLPIIQEFAHKDSRIIVFDIPNGGVSHARNVGLDAAQGEYITFVDADDSIRPGFFENLVRCIEESKADLVISGFSKVNDNGMVLREVRPNKFGIHKFEQILPEFSAEQKISGILGYSCAKIYSRLKLKDVRFNESLKLAEDFDFYLNLYETIGTIYFDDHVDYLYLQEADNSTGNIASDEIDYLAQLRICLHYRSMLKKRNAYNGENRQIVEGRFCDYAFFVLFHTPLQYYRDWFESLYELCGRERIILRGRNLLRKWLFFCLRYHLYHVAGGTMALYRAARWIRNAIK